MNQSATAPIEITDDEIQVDAALLTKAFGIKENELKEKMRSGEISHFLERGEGQDAGQLRLTFASGTHRVCITTDTGGKVLKTSLMALPTLIST